MNSRILLFAGHSRYARQQPGALPNIPAILDTIEHELCHGIFPPIASQEATHHAADDACPAARTHVGGVTSRCHSARICQCVRVLALISSQLCAAEARFQQ